MKIEGVKAVIAALKERNRKWLEESQSRAPGLSGKVSVAVGFTAAYALYAHENMEIWPPGMRLAGQPRQSPGKGYYWDPQGMAGPKFLENPARRLSNSGEFSRILTALMRQGKSVAQALLACGLRLLREAQQRVPVDTANLKSSGFVVLE